ncbi:hypothetical protein ACFSX5_18605 [Devosia albogilva]|uniref:YkgJ family cysteine cluster protein n=1 Tax=Devosia albogilva TaxID=429726 RepID=A0ABW5QQ47_9HYPH
MLKRLADRSCGDCTACCEFIPIRSPELDKPSNTLCPHCLRGRGCTVYEVRPQPCRGWYCGWFFLADLGSEWHPSSSGVVLRPEAIENDAMTVVILRRSAFLLSEAFAGAIGAWVAAGVTVSFERVGPAGHLPAKTEMNGLLAPAIQQRSLPELHKAFSWAIAHIDNHHRWEPDGLTLRTTLAETTNNSFQSRSVTPFAGQS